MFFSPRSRRYHGPHAWDVATTGPPGLSRIPSATSYLRGAQRSALRQGMRLGCLGCLSLGSCLPGICLSVSAYIICIYIFIYLYLYRVYPSIYPSTCLSIYLPICLSIDHQLKSRIYNVDRLVGWPCLVVVQQGKLGELILA